MHAITSGEGKDKIAILQNAESNTVVEIFAFGAVLNKFETKTKNATINVIDGFTSSAEAQKNITEAFKSAKLSPFVCRLHNAAFSFEQQQYKINKAVSGTSALHGLLFDQVFEIVRTEETDKAASVELQYTYSKADDGFSFPYLMNIIYTLFSNDILEIKTTVKNTGTTDMPLSDGWHPYFKLGESINDAAIKFNTKEMFVFDSTLLPTGERIPYTTFNDFKQIDSLELDNSFLLDGFDKEALVLKDESIGIELKIYVDASYPVLQIYTPPHRKSIAVENLSSPPDAFNNHINLIVAKPNEEHVFTTKYQLVKL